MRLRIHWRTALAVAACLALAGCGKGTETGPGPTRSSTDQKTPLKNEIPADRLAEVLKAHQEGVGHMERFTEYPQAVEAFRKVHELAPGWIPGSINLAIALLNDSGSKAEAAKENRGTGGESAPRGNFDEAIALLDDVLEREPDGPAALHAHYCRGLIYEDLGQIPKAHEDYAYVVEHDPTDGHAWYRFGSTLPSTAEPDKTAGPAEAEELVKIYTKALECNPYLVSAMYKLQQVSGWTGNRDRQRELIALWRTLNPDLTTTGVANGETVGKPYSEQGRYAMVIDLDPNRVTSEEPVSPPRFEPPTPIPVRLPDGQRWAKASDLTGPLALFGRFRERFGMAVAHLDADGDGKLDLYLAAAVIDPEGHLRDILLRNRGDGQFEDATASLHLPDDRASLGVAAGDFDADGRIDLFLTGVGDNRLLRNRGAEGFEDVTKSLGDNAPPAISPTARFLDLDLDGDLDLYVVNYTASENAENAFTDQPPPGLANAAYRNDGTPPKVEGKPQNQWAPVAVKAGSLETDEGLSIAFSPWPEDQAEALQAGDGLHTGVAALDLDDDRDLDLVLTADDQPPTIALNDRLGRFHAVDWNDTAWREPINGLLVADLDRDGRADLATVHTRGKLALWRNRSPKGTAPEGAVLEFWPTNAHDWRQALVADLDLDGKLDLLGLPLAEGDPPFWARNEGSHLQSHPLALGPGGTARLQGLGLANLVGDPLPDLILVRDGEPPRIARNLGNGHHWLALDFQGRWKFGKGADGSSMRTNPQGLGTQVTLQSVGLDVPYHHTTTEAGPSQSVGPVVLGLGPHASAHLVRLVWPDGVIQCEMNQQADRVAELVEFNRKTGSCPVLFTWNGQRFVCLGDFLGGGGLGLSRRPRCVRSARPRRGRRHRPRPAPGRQRHLPHGDHRADG